MVIQFEQSTVMLLVSRLDAKDGRILYVLKVLKQHGLIRVRESLIHKIFYYITRDKLSVKFDFYDNVKFSYEIRERLEKLCERGYIRRIFLVARLGGVYIPLYSITEKGLEYLERRERLSKKDARIIEEFISKVAKKKSFRE